MWHAYISLDEIRSYNWSLWQLVIIASTGLLIAVIGLISGLAWHILLVDQGAHSNLKQNLMVLCISQIAKYIPGNIGQYLGRIYFSEKIGISSSIVTISMVIETLWLLSVATTLSLLTFFQTAVVQKKPDFLSNLSNFDLLLIATICFLTPFLLTNTIKFFGRLIKKVNVTNFTQPKLATCFKIWSIDLIIFLFHGLIVTLHLHLFSNEAGFNIFLNTLLYASVWLAGYLFPGAPAGLGVREAATFIIFSSFYDAPTSIAISVSLRITSIIGDALTYFIGIYIKKWT